MHDNIESYKFCPSYFDEKIKIINGRGSDSTSST